MVKDRLAAPVTGERRTMKAIVFERYGTPANALDLRKVAVPAIEEHQVLLRVRASSVNPMEWYTVTGLLLGRPQNGLRKPKRTALGADVAGVVEAVGSDVKELQPGDEVFGTCGAAWAEYAPAREARLVPKPTSLSFEEAAAVPVAGLTAVQALRDKGRVQAGEKVLVNGASGGVGTFTVQLAKWFGAEVTAVCHTRNVELVQSLGADHVVDYVREDFTRGDERYDLMIDIAGSRSFLESRRVLKPDARVVVVGAPRAGRVLGPLAHTIGMRVLSMGRSQPVTFFISKITQEDLLFLQGLLAEGDVTPVIDRRYELSQLPDALAYLGEGHARAKVVVAVQE